MELGRWQKLLIVKKVDFGLYLKEEEGSDYEILLPNNQVLETDEVGDEIEVFLYKDSSDRPIATRLTPLITLGEIKKLRVKEITKVGVFLDWGLPKDLLLPFKEQNYRPEKDEFVLVTLYVDLSDRLCASMNIYNKLSLDSPYQKDDEVSGYVYQVSEEYGAYVAVDFKYSALIPKKELHFKIKPGTEIRCRVMGVKEDGKLDLSLRKKGKEQILEDARLILDRLKEAKGFLPLHDKSSAKEIEDEFEISKAAFKRAVGNLLKEKKIDILENGIRLK